MNSQHQGRPADQPDTTCGAVRGNRAGTVAYTGPCVLKPDHDGFHYSRRNRTGEWERWMWVSDPRASQGRTVATVRYPAVPDLSDERLAAVLGQWAAEQAGPDDRAGGQS